MANGGTISRILALWVRMGTGEKCELVWATTHYASHPTDLSRLTFCFCTPPFCVTFSLTCFLLFFVRCFCHSSPRSSSHVCCHFSCQVSHVLCCSRYVPAVLFRMLLQHHFLVAFSLSLIAHFLSYIIHKWLTNFAHVSRHGPDHCINGNSYLNIVQ